MIYTVNRINEDLDFGCEERPEDAPVMAVVSLIDCSGEECRVKAEDAMLYERNINEGDKVYFDKDNKLEKALNEGFKEQHSDVEIMAYCGPEEGPSIGFGSCFSHDEWPSNDVSWIYEGISDSLSENWEEFDGIAEQAIQECKEYFLLKNNMPTSESEVKNIALQMIAKIVGPCAIAYEIDGESIDLSYLVDDDGASAAIFECINDNFAVASSVFNDLKKVKWKDFY